MTLDMSQPDGCPHCGNLDSYQLGDGRHKCRACQRKFSPNRRRSRLSTEATEAIVSGFTSGTPASSVAAATGLNLKTVHHYYNRIRELLAEERERHLTHSYGSPEVSPELFADAGTAHKLHDAVFIGCLIAQDDETELLFASDSTSTPSADLQPESISGWIVAADRKALNNIELDRINCIDGLSTREKARSFWINTKRRLANYCGGFKNHFRLYLREMEFRNNMKNKSAAREHIEALLGQKSTKSTGEKDA